MKHVVMIFLSFFLMAGVSYGVPADKEKMSEDIQTMSRLIDGELQKEFSGKYTLGLWNRGCIGLYLEDYGVVFTTRVQFPIFDYNEVKSEEKKEPSDLWEVYEKGQQPGKDIMWVQEYEMKLRTYLQPGTNIAKSQANEIKKLEKFLTEIICKYAGKIDQLSSDEYITIAVQGNRNFGSPSIRYFEAAAENADEAAKPEVLSLKFKQNKYFDSSVFLSGTTGRSLIMRIKKKDIGKNCSDKIEMSFH